MYSKAEAAQLKHEFWISFAEKYPRKWLLYDTKIKDFSFKFYVDNKKAQVFINIEPKNNQTRLIYFQKIESLKSILEEDFIQDLIYEYNFTLENGKEISKIWVEINNVGFSNRKNWGEIFDFFNEKMDLFERFFYEYRDYISDLEINT